MPLPGTITIKHSIPEWLFLLEKFTETGMGEEYAKTFLMPFPGDETDLYSETMKWLFRWDAA